ncbi:hypothetical protein PCANB_000321 [Pneumocystis canis]|nr:hypothetical protein PCK1_000313 [Pneumocystis canis]KAG5437975.1 hypothetical protein PCANB_000321 [Pneumocystis canis]
MTKISNISSISKRLRSKRRFRSSNNKTTLPVKQTPITKEIKNIESKNLSKDEFVTVSIPRNSLRILQDANSQKFIEMLDNHFQDLQCTFQDRSKKDIDSLTEKTIKEISRKSDDIFQHIEHELEYARSDCAFILNQEEILRQTQQQAKQIQIEIQTLLLPTEPFELEEDIWTEVNKLLEEANILTNKYLHKMRDSMHKCSEVDRKNKRRLMNRLF